MSAIRLELDSFGIREVNIVAVSPEYSVSGEACKLVGSLGPILEAMSAGIRLYEERRKSGTPPAPTVQAKTATCGKGKRKK